MACPYPSLNVFPPVTSEECNSFYRRDRELYTVLAIRLSRDPLESLHVMALWIWLERVGYRNWLVSLATLPILLIGWLADEAVTCLNCINNDQFPVPGENNDIHLTQTFMEKEISLEFFHENRLLAIKGMAKVINEVCLKAFTDLMKVANERNINRALMNLSLSNVPPKPINTWGGLAPDDRTVFVTFSKGYPVFEWELRDYFTRFYGDCVETLNMQDVVPLQQSLYARIIFKSSSTVQLILNSTNTNASGMVKLTVNGKHVWARKFVPRHLRNPQPQLALPRPPPPPA